MNKIRTDTGFTNRVKCPFMNPKPLQLFVILGVFYLLVGCAPPSPVTHQDNGESTSIPIVISPSASEADPLDGTEWKLESIVDQEKNVTISNELQPLLWFNEGALGLDVGCNDITGYYEIDKDNITVTFSEQTVMDCTDRLGSAIMEMEEFFYKTMPTFQSYSIDDDQLQIYYADGVWSFRRSSN